MTEGYIQVPTDESGKRLRTWLSGSTHSEAVVLTLPDTNNTFIDPRYVTISGATVPLGATGSITGSINNWPSTYAVTESGQWRINVTGSSPDSSIIISGSVNQLGQWQVNATGSITGSINNWPSSYAVTQSGTWNVTGSINNTVSTLTAQSGQWTVNITGSQSDSSVKVSGSMNQLGQWRVNVTGSSPDSAVIISGSVNQLGQWAIYATGSGPSSAVLVTGSVYQAGNWNVTGSINNWPSTYNVTPVVSGSGIYTQASAVMVTGSVNLNTGLAATTGSINNWPSTYTTTQSGQWNINITGSGTSPLPVSISGSINSVASGSGIYTYASAQMVTGSINLNSVPAITGSINNWPTTYSVTPVISGSGVYTYASAAMVTGSININSIPSHALTAGTTTIGAVVISGSGWQATVTQGSGSDNARYAQDVNIVKTKTYKCQGVSGSISANSIATLITGLANRHLKVYSIIYNQSGSSANQISFFSSGSGLANAQLLGPMPLGINEGFATGVSPPAWIICTAVTGSSLYVSSSAAAVHGGILSYFDDDAS